MLTELSIFGALESNAASCLRNCIMRFGSL